MTQHVLFIVTNAAVLGPHNRKVGFFFPEVAHPFGVLDAAGVAVEFASPAGGWTPYDAYDESDASQKAFFESKAFRRLNRSRKLSDVDAADYDAILIPGGLGPMVDIQRNRDVQAAVVRAWSTDKIVAAVCHGPCGLLGVDLGDGKPFVHGKRLTGFSMKEEFDYAREDVPYELEEALVAEGAEYSSADNWQPHVVIDGRLITGQNPASAERLSEELLAALSRASLR